MKKYLVRRGDVILGSFSATDLKNLVAQGQLHPTDEFRVDGDESATWKPLSSVQGLVFRTDDNASSDKKSFHLPKDDVNNDLDYGSGALFAKIVDGIVELLRSFLGGGGVGSALRNTIGIGHIGLVVCSVLASITSLWLAIKADSISILGVAAFIVAMLFIGQWCAARFGTAGEQLIKCSPTEIRRLDILDMIGLVAATCGIASLVGGIYVSLRVSSPYEFLYGCGGAVIALGFASVAFSPKQLNIRQNNQLTAGEEAIGIIAFVAKSALFLGPFFYALTSLLSCALYSFALYGLATSTSSLELGRVSVTLPTAGLTAIVGCFIPFFTYLAFLGNYLLVDLYRAIIAAGTKALENKN